MNPCFSPPKSYRAQPGAAAVHNGFLGGLLKHHAVRAVDSFAPPGLGFQEDRRAPVQPFCFVGRA